MKHLIRLLTALNAVVTAGLLVTGYSDRADAAAHPLLAILGLGFPVMAALNGAFLIVWTLVRWKRVWLPVAGFIVSFQPMWTYCPLNRQPSQAKAEADSARLLRIVTFNVGTPWTTDDLDTLRQWMERSDADIICLQELPNDVEQVKAFNRSMEHKYPYHNTLITSERTVLYSRWPAFCKKKIDIESRGNSAGIVLLRVRDHVLAVVMCHLETNGLSREDKDRFGSTVRGEVGMDSMRSESRTLIGKLQRAAQIRAAQTDSIVWYIRRSLDQQYSVIVCGDLNDSPISPTRRRIARELTDVYTAKGRGTGWTYRQNGINVRIDHLFCSSDIEPLSVSVDHNTTFSDHYPLAATLRLAW